MFGFDLPLWLLGLGAGLRKAAVGIFTFLTTSPGVYVLIAGLAFGAYWWSGEQGYKRGVAEIKAENLLAQATANMAAYKRGLDRQKNIDAALTTISYNAGLERGRLEAKTITLIRKVPVYVTAETDAAFPVPCGVYRTINAANSERSAEDYPLPGPLVDGDACPLTASDVATNATEVAGLYYKAAAKIGELQAVVRRLVEELSGAKVGQLMPNSGYLGVQGADLRAHDEHQESDLQQKEAVAKRVAYLNAEEIAHTLLNGPRWP